MKNRTTVKDRRGVNLLQFINENEYLDVFLKPLERMDQLVVLDFNSNCVLLIADDQLKLQCPKAFLLDASGPLVNWIN